MDEEGFREWQIRGKGRGTGVEVTGGKRRIQEMRVGDGERRE